MKNKNKTKYISELHNELIKEISLKTRKFSHKIYTLYDYDYFFKNGKNILKLDLYFQRFTLNDIEIAQWDEFFDCLLEKHKYNSVKEVINEIMK